MSRPPPEEYLDPAFDPSKLTISTICSILSSHDIELPVSKHRKEFYVELFNAKLKPRQQEILQSILDIVPSDDGIIKVSDPSNFDFGLESDEEVVVSGSDIDVSEEKTDDDRYEVKRKEYIEIQSRIPIPAAENIKRVKLSPEPMPTPLNKIAIRKFKGSPNKKTVLRELGNKPPSSEIKPPISHRFMVSPSLPGIRKTIPQEKVSVKEMLKKFGHKYAVPVTSEEFTDDSDQFESNHQEDAPEVDSVDIICKETELAKPPSERWIPILSVAVTLVLATTIVYIYSHVTSNGNLSKIYGSLVVVEVNQFLGEVFSFARDFGTSASDLIDSVAQNARGYFQKPSYFEEMVRKITALFVRFNFSVRKLFSSYLVPSAYEARDLFATKLSVVNRYANQALGKGLIQSVTSVIEIIEEYCMIWMSRLLEAARYFSEFLLTWTKAVYSGITNGNVREIVTQCRAGVRTGLEFVHGKFLTMYSSLCIDNIAKILRGLIPETLQLSISGVLLVTGIGFISLAYLLSA